MEKKIKLRFVYVVEGHVAAENVDTYFYTYLPNVETELTDLHTGHRVTDIPPLDQTISVKGTSVASCTTLAAIIRDYLQHRKSRIVIYGPHEYREYEGPTLKTDTAEIAAVIFSLTEDSGEDGLTIMSFHLPESTTATA